MLVYQYSFCYIYTHHKFQVTPVKILTNIICADVITVFNLSSSMNKSDDLLDFIWGCSRRIIDHLVFENIFDFTNNFAYQDY